MRQELLLEIPNYSTPQWIWSHIWQPEEQYNPISYHEDQTLEIRRQLNRYPPPSVPHHEHFLRSVMWLEAFIIAVSRHSPKVWRHAMAPTHKQQ